MSSEETIGLAEAVAIWLNTGKFPGEADGVMTGSESELRKFGVPASSSVYVFHKDQRFIKPVERKSCIETIDELYEEHDGERRHRRIIGILANRIDELERKAK